MMIFLAIIGAFVIHESGHYLAAFAFGRRLEFRFALGWIGGKIPIPRYVWYMPDVEAWKQKTIAIAGFGAEMLAALLFWIVGGAFWRYYAVVTLLHFIAYPYYAGEENDFKWIISHGDL
ncbi:hypothetical protein FACS1894204_04080 [Synergistales bacterium]|nr:hypothetical protein FACS1894204_04080 [Synergistales bacterium]